MKITKTKLKQIICEEIFKEFEENPPWSADEIAEHEISHAAERESRELTKQFRGSLKKGVGKAWGEATPETREEEVAAAAAELMEPRLYAALEMPPGVARDDAVKHVVYVLDSLQPGSYEPSEVEKDGQYGDPSKAGAPPPRRLSGTLPNLGIDLARE
mgnify:CR=1 FL=1|jgi:hypothetical protein